MRLIILAVFLSSCSMIHKASSKQMKDSTAVSVDNSKQFVKTDSTYTSTNKEIETADLVVVLKDTATGFVVLSADSISIPAAAIKEIRHKKRKEKQSNQSTQVIRDQAIITDTRQKVTVSQKTVTKEKHVYRLPWLWLLVIIPIFLLYRFRGRIYEFFKAFTIR